MCTVHELIISTRATACCSCSFVTHQFSHFLLGHVYWLILDLHVLDGILRHRHCRWHDMVGYRLLGLKEVRLWRVVIAVVVDHVCAIARLYIDRQKGIVGDIVEQHYLAIDVDFNGLVHPMLELIHGGAVASSHATSTLGLLASSTPLILARVEVRSSEVGRSVVVRTIGLVVTAGFAVGQEVAVRRLLFTNPHSASLSVLAIDVSTEFVFAMKALRLVMTKLTEDCLTLRLTRCNSCNLCLAFCSAIFSSHSNHLWLP